MESLVNTLNGILWSPALIVLCLGAGLFFSIVTRFVQVRHFKEMVRLLLKGSNGSEGISSFQALAVSLSGRVGIGNIAGVAAAIGFGGPGAIFWMWVVAFLGAASSYVESTLAQLYKEKDTDKGFRGGPAFYFEKALGVKWFSWVFALATLLACGLFLPSLQAHGIVKAVEVAFGTGPIIDTAFGDLTFTSILTGTLITILLGFIIFGGVKRIARFTEIVVPFMAFAYLITAMAIIFLNFEQVPSVIALIISDAFSPMAGFGAAVGWGVKRGIYSSEAGQGTGPHAAAAALVEHPAQQGLVQALAVYIDTLLVCTATAFMIIITGSYNVHGGAEGVFLVQNLAETVSANSSSYTQAAIESTFPGIGKIFVAISLCFFAFTTILAYYFISETNLYYINKYFKKPILVPILKSLLLFAAFSGSIKAANVAWGLGDIGVAIMAWINIIGILIIFWKAKPAIKALKDYERQLDDGHKTFTFNPKAAGIKDATYWENLNKKD